MPLYWLFSSKQSLLHLLVCWRHRLIRLAFVLLCAAVFFSLTLPILAATPGDLDSGFGNGGIVTPTLSMSPFLANTIAIQPDGKIVTAGGNPSAEGLFVVLRHTPDGSLDSSFGNGGVVTTSFSSSYGSPNQGPVGLALQADGKIVVLGTKSISAFSKALAVARYTITGSLDSTFGQNGIVTTTVDKHTGFFIGVAIQSDGKIIAGGSSENNASQENFTVVRYTVTGTLDSTFGSNGVVTTSIAGIKTRGYSVAIQSTGKIVIGGSSGFTTFALARFTITGSLDSTFGNNGVVTTSIDSVTGGDAVAIQPDDKILIVGSTNGITSTTGTLALARYNTNGSLDSGFGSSGIITTSINGYGDGNGIALQPDGKIIAVGTGKTISNSLTFALLRYHSDGSLDHSFGSNGIVAAPISNYALGYNVAIQPDHKIVVVGDSTYTSGTRYTLARYFGDMPNLDPTRQTYLPVVLKP
jgi:uncharacterized delta-60 repeat protein